MNGELRQTKIEFMEDFIYKNLISAARSSEYSIEFLGLDISKQYATRKRLKMAASIAAEYVIDNTPEDGESLTEEESIRIMTSGINIALEQTDFANA
jgi:hypothetical protein